MCRHSRTLHGWAFHKTNGSRRVWVSEREGEWVRVRSSCSICPLISVNNSHLDRRLVENERLKSCEEVRMSRTKKGDPSFLWPYWAIMVLVGACHLLLFFFCLFVFQGDGAHEWAVRWKPCIAAFIRGGAASIQSAAAVYGRLISQEPLFCSVLSSSFPRVVGSPVMLPWTDDFGLELLASLNSNEKPTPPRRRLIEEKTSVRVCLCFYDAFLKSSFLSASQSLWDEGWCSGKACWRTFLSKKAANRKKIHFSHTLTPKMNEYNNT